MYEVKEEVPTSDLIQILKAKNDKIKQQVE